MQTPQRASRKQVYVALESGGARKEAARGSRAHQPTALKPSAVGPCNLHRQVAVPGPAARACQTAALAPLRLVFDNSADAAPLPPTAKTRATDDFPTP